MNEDDNLIIFYAHSTRNSSCELYNAFCDRLGGGKYLIQDPNKDPRAYNLADEILEQINESDLFIADITPDDVKIDQVQSEEKTEEKRTYTFNPHVMCELQHARTNNMDIIILHDNRIIKSRADIPIFFQGCQTQEYDDHNNALDSLAEFVKNYKKETAKKYQYIDDARNESMINILSQIVGCNIVRIVVSYNFSASDIALFCHNRKGLHGIISLSSMAYIIVSRKIRKYIDLSCFKDLTSELKHIQTISLIKWSLME
jgi:hypothetical protein